KNIVATGSTDSTLYPIKDLSGVPNSYIQTTNKGGGSVNLSQFGFNEAVLTKFDSSKNLIASTYFGGDGDDEATSLTQDKFGNYYIGGNTATNTNFPFPNQPFQGYVDSTHADGHDESSDGFIVGFKNNFIHFWSTYYGGTRGFNSGRDFIQEVNVSTVEDKIYVCGLTESKPASFPLKDLGGSSYFQDTLSGGVFDGFMARLDLSSITSIKENRENSNKKNLQYL
ncbi:MAG: hypothetical protein ABEH43_00185, partial [Flavobacteriales bacterium]